MSKSKLFWASILVGLAGMEACSAAGIAPPKRTSLAPLASATPSISTTATASETPSAPEEEEEPEPPPEPVQPPPPDKAPETKGMVLLPGGTFKTLMSARLVKLVPFWLDVAEVTAAAYEACVKAGKCTDEGLACGEKPNYRKWDKKSHPINCVDQSQARAYCEHVGKRLPVFEEWEWAARATTRGWPYPWGEGLGGEELCWRRSTRVESIGRVRHCNDEAKKDCFFVSGVVHEDRVEGTCPTRAYPAGNSPEGISDLAGNVGEWTQSEESANSFYACGEGWRQQYQLNMIETPCWASDPAEHLDSEGFRCASTAPEPAAP